jgi:hypothetical protein
MSHVAIEDKLMALPNKRVRLVDSKHGSEKLKTKLIWTIGLLLTAMLALEIYTRLPSSAVASELNLPADTTYAVLLFHGTGGKDEPLLIEVAERIQQAIGNQPGVAIRHYVWSPWSDNRLRAGKNGGLIGLQIGQELAGLEQLRYLRVISHSAGAYLQTPLCEAYKAAAENPAHVEMTYLDSMGIRGGWDYYYGYRHYGECADFSATIFTSDDPVPGTNAPLEQSYSIDVTATPSRSDIDGHLWPIEYFLNNLSAEELRPGLRSHEQLPRGAVEQ